MQGDWSMGEAGPNLLPQPRYPCATGVGKTSRALGRNTQNLTSPGKSHPLGKDVSLRAARSRLQLRCSTGAATGHVLSGQKSLLRKILAGMDGSYGQEAEKAEAKGCKQQGEGWHEQ